MSFNYFFFLKFYLSKTFVQVYVTTANFIFYLQRAKKVFDPSDNHVPKKRGRPLGSLNKSTIEKQLAKMAAEENRPDSRTSTGSREQGGVCSVCHIQNKRGPNDRMVSCRECSNKGKNITYFIELFYKFLFLAHLSCLNGDDNMMLKMYPDNTWQCPHCKTCVVCFETSNAVSIFFRIIDSLLFNICLIYLPIFYLIGGSICYYFSLLR